MADTRDKPTSDLLSRYWTVPVITWSCTKLIMWNMSGILPLKWSQASVRKLAYRRKKKLYKFFPKKLKHFIRSHNFSNKQKLHNYFKTFVTKISKTKSSKFPRKHFGQKNQNRFAIARSWFKVWFFRKKLFFGRSKKCDLCKISYSPWPQIATLFFQKTQLQKSVTIWEHLPKGTIFGL